MKKIILLLLCFTATNLFAQQTKSFSVTGIVKKASTITIDTLLKYAQKDIGGINITSHTGDFKHRDEKLQGVLLKDVLSNTVYDVSSPKLLSELYLVFVAADGYKVVYSWNELYNTETGNNVYIITTKNGIKLDAMPESIQMVSPLDFKTGRRYLHNLSKIIIKRAD
ncbi:MAG: molybdopterin-binding protein [Sphingobacteriaceae bacterium]|nr:MAG: molybdopterin-binding protein [Sphingobacteriaceae bacterium]